MPSNVTMLQKASSKLMSSLYMRAIWSAIGPSGPNTCNKETLGMACSPKDDEGKEIANRMMKGVCCGEQEDEPLGECLCGKGVKFNENKAILGGIGPSGPNTCNKETLGMACSPKDGEGKEIANRMMK